MTALLLEIFSFLAAVSVLATTGKLQPQSGLSVCTTSKLNASVASVFIFRVWHDSQATPKLLNLCVTNWHEVARNELCVGGSLTCFIYLLGLLRLFSSRKCYCLNKLILHLEVSMRVLLAVMSFAGNEVCLPRTSTFVFSVHLMYFKHCFVQ